MAFGKRREEFDHTSQGGAWEEESVSTGKAWVSRAQERASKRDQEDKDQTPPRRRMFGL